jgi:endonuclease YncB( thermonuclease family)
LATHAAEFDGQVVGISDGDTLTVQTDDNQRVRVRLAGIDAPEHDQPYGTAATRSLAALALNRTVRVRRVAEDDYGRMVGVVVADGRDLDAEQVRRGMAWVYRRYSRSRRLYALEAEAKQARRGLWADRIRSRRGTGGMVEKSRSRRRRRRPPFSAGRNALAGK